MPTPTSTFRFSDLTRRQIAALVAATGHTQTAVVSTAIDRMYREEIKTMNTQNVNVTITTINTKPEYDPYVNLPGHTSYSEFWLDPRDRTCGVSQQYRTGGTSGDVWNGHVLTYRLMAHPSEIDIRRDLEDHADLLQRVCDGYESHWNGSNHVARYTPDARAAWAELCEILDSNTAHYVFWELDEWIDEAMRSTITADTTDAEIRAYCAEWTQPETIDGLHVVLNGDIDDAVRLVTEYRDGLRET